MIDPDLEWKSADLIGFVWYSTYYFKFYFFKQHFEYNKGAVKSFSYCVIMNPVNLIKKNVIIFILQNERRGHFICCLTRTCGEFFYVEYILSVLPHDTFLKVSYFFFEHRPNYTFLILLYFF